MDIEDIVTGVEIELAKQNKPAEELERLSRNLDMTQEEHSLFQEKKSLAQAQGVLSLENAMYIYNQLGGTASVFNRQPLAVKIVLTQVYARLLKARSA